MCFFADNGFVLHVQEGSTWSSNCTNYKCTKTAAGAMILGSGVVCPPFNDTECTKVCTLGEVSNNNSSVSMEFSPTLENAHILCVLSLNLKKVVSYKM